MHVYKTNLGVNVISLNPIEKGDVIEVKDYKGNSVVKYVESMKPTYLELESYKVQTVVIKN